MAQKRYTVEQIIAKRREAKVAGAHRAVTSSGHWRGGHRTASPKGAFLIPRPPAGSAADEDDEGEQLVKLILNWFEELKRLVPTGR